MLEGRYVAEFFLTSKKIYLCPETKNIIVNYRTWLQTMIFMDFIMYFSLIKQILGLFRFHIINIKCEISNFLEIKKWRQNYATTPPRYWAQVGQKHRL